LIVLNLAEDDVSNSIIFYDNFYLKHEFTGILFRCYKWYNVFNV